MPRRSSKKEQSPIIEAEFDDSGSETASVGSPVHEEEHVPTPPKSPAKKTKKATKKKSAKKAAASGAGADEDDAQSKISAEEETLSGMSKEEIEAGLKKVDNAVIDLATMLSPVVAAVREMAAKMVHDKMNPALEAHCEFLHQPVEGMVCMALELASTAHKGDVHYGFTKMHKVQPEDDSDAAKKAARAATTAAVKKAKEEVTGQVSALTVELRKTVVADATAKKKKIEREEQKRIRAEQKRIAREKEEQELMELKETDPEGYEKLMAAKATEKGKKKTTGKKKLSAREKALAQTMQKAPAKTKQQKAPAKTKQHTPSLDEIDG